ncbi:DUF4328 domain-containing protein [Streptomyces sp. NBC_01762]|uniref:DUF4328 domain-containing protein n=1 Tax=Streptomyces sp. NBC_01762 TaxID=2975933 RepID=UPI002DDBE41B|nr:DUF4328 domain-containing protein [Streptomyces sp. NBC_01762]WSC48858.1 DUF4328 domain-containing protein [Streptomyces sp. NBC_01762]
MTTVVIAALGVCVLVNAALLIAQLRLYRATDGSYAAFQREVWVGNLTGMRLLAFLVTGFVFLRWLWQMRVNAEALAPRGHRMKRGWTTGGWLVPVACFFLPKRIINDIWAASSPPDRPRRTDVLLTSWVAALRGGAASRLSLPLPGPTADRDGRSRAVHRHRSAVYRCGAAACRDAESASRRLSPALCPIRHGHNATFGDRKATGVT